MIGKEFFHTFNTLFDGRKQIVLSSDRPASEITNLEQRLVSRLECGLTTELQPQRPQGGCPGVPQVLSMVLSPWQRGEGCHDEISTNVEIGLLRPLQLTGEAKRRTPFGSSFTRNMIRLPPSRQNGNSAMFDARMRAPHLAPIATHL